LTTPLGYLSTRSNGSARNEARRFAVIEITDHVNQRHENRSQDTRSRWPQALPLAYRLSRQIGVRQRVSAPRGGPGTYNRVTVATFP
jgi:hypothetical protein